MRRIALAGAALLATLLLINLSSRRKVASPEMTGVANRTDFANGGPLRRNSVSSMPLSQSVEPLGSRLARLLAEDRNLPRLTAAELADYLARNQSNAFSLVAAFEATLDVEMLKQAAAHFPNDPMVQAKVLMNNVFPEERGKWIQALKESSPNNSLPHLLGAADLMARGDANGALAEVMSSAGKGYNDFSREGRLGLEEAYLETGASPVEAVALSHSQLHLPSLAPLKDLGSRMADLAVEYGRAGDAGSQQLLLEGVWQAGTQVRQSGQSGMLLTELVGLALQNMALQRWPEGAPARFLDGAILERSEENQRFRRDMRSASGVFGRWLADAPENEIANYYSHLRVLGEGQAMHWLRSQHPDLAGP